MFYYLALKTDIRGDLMENKEDRISEELHNEKIENVESTEETKEDVPVTETTTTKTVSTKKRR